MDYFQKNWGGNKKYWAAYLTNNFVNLGNTINNRIESHSQKIKDVLDRSKSLAEAVRGILLLHRSKMYAPDHESFNQTMKVPYRFGDDDKVADSITKTLTPYAVRITVEVLKMARIHSDRYGVSACKCTLTTTMVLPCRHMFATRIRSTSDKDASHFLREDALERWHINYYKSLRNKRRADPVEDLTPIPVPTLKHKHVHKATTKPKT